MKRLGFVVLAVSLSQAAQAAISVKTELELPNAKPLAREALLNKVSMGSVSFGDTYVIIESSERAGDKMLMRAQVFRTENGVRKLVARPTVLAKIGEPAEISERGKNGKLLYRLKLTPTKTR